MPSSVRKSGSSWGHVRVMPLVIFVQAAVIAVLLWQRVTMPSAPAPARVVPDAPQSRPAPLDVRPAFETGTDSRAIAEAEAAYRLAALVRTPRPESGTTGSPSDPIGIVVYGRVVDEAGFDVSGASVEFEDENGTTRRADLADGDWHVAYGLHPGKWSVRVTACAFRDFNADVVLSDSSSRFRYDAVLRRSTIVFVRFETPSGERLRHELYEKFDLFAFEVPTAVVTAEPVGRGSLSDVRCLARPAWDDEGIRRRGIDPPDDWDGFFDVGVDPPFWVHALACDMILASQEVRAPLELVVFKIAPAAIASKFATVTVRVVDAESRAPIEGASVAVEPGNCHSGEATPPDGKLTLQNRMPGLAHLRIEADGFERYEKFIRLEPGQNLDLGDIALGRRVSIRGRLVGVDGRPIVGTVSCVDVEVMTFPQPFLCPNEIYSTRSDGNFEIVWFGRGRYLLRGEDGRNASSPVLVDTTGGEVRDVEVRMVQGVTLSLDLDLSGLNRLVELRNPAGHLVLSELDSGATRMGVAVPPGTYTLTIRNGVEVTHTRQITVGSSPLRVRASG